MEIVLCSVITSVIHIFVFNTSTKYFIENSVKLELNKNGAIGQNTNNCFNLNN